MHFIWIPLMPAFSAFGKMSREFIGKENKT
jgi:hypothetical protein